MGRLKGLVVVILALLLITIPVSSASTKEKSPAKTLRIGALICLTGWFSTFDTLEWEEAQLARDMLNERGGITIKGQKYLIELIAEDCKSTADGVVAAANKLVYDEKVKFIAGPAAFFSAAAKEVCEPEKVLRATAFVCSQPNIPGAVRHTRIPLEGIPHNTPSLRKIRATRFVGERDLLIVCESNPADGDREWFHEP